MVVQKQASESAFSLSGAGIERKNESAEGVYDRLKGKKWIALNGVVLRRTAKQRMTGCADEEHELMLAM